MRLEVIAIYLISYEFPVEYQYFTKDKCDYTILFESSETTFFHLIMGYIILFKIYIFSKVLFFIEDPRWRNG